jgi:pimeloyl-ACP methyl ester carboxylesterase
MAKDAITFIRALDLEEVDLVAFSMGGMIAQVIVRDEPRLVRRLILAGTGPAGGEGIEKVTAISNRDLIRGLLTFQDPSSSSSSPGLPIGVEPARSSWHA